MSFTVSIATAIAAGLIGDGVRKAAPGVLSIFGEALERIQSGSLGVFIFGPGGVGKTTLQLTMGDQRQITDPTRSYIASTSVEKEDFDENRFYSVEAGPGQLALAQSSWPRMFERVSQTRNALCIFCFSYGYETPWKLSVSSDGRENTTALQSYIDDRRQAEIERFDSFKNAMVNYTGRLALLNLVTKQDLWWSNAESVERFYADPPFSDIVTELRSAKEAAGFIHDSCSVSLSIENLIGYKNDVLVPVSEGYDQALQEANYQNFRHKVSEMLGVLKAT